MRDQPQTIINEGAKMVAEKSKEFNPIEDAQRDCDVAPTVAPAQKLMLADLADRMAAHSSSRRGSTSAAFSRCIIGN